MTWVEVRLGEPCVALGGVSVARVSRSANGETGGSS